MSPAVWNLKVAEEASCILGNTEAQTTGSSGMLMQGQSTAMNKHI